MLIVSKHCAQIHTRFNIDFVGYNQLANMVATNVYSCVMAISGYSNGISVSKVLIAGFQFII